MNPTHGGPGGPPWPGAPQDPTQAPEQAYPQQQQGWPQQPQQQGWPQQPQQQGWPQQPQQQGWPQQQQQGWPQQQQQQGWPQQQGQQPMGNPYAAPMGIPSQGTSLSGEEGFKYPRLAGLGIFACGLLLAGVNWHEIESNGQYYIKALVVTPVAFLLGMWLMIAGQPRDERGEIAVWGKIGAGVTTGAGVVLGILACVLVGC
jgi:hypothetical protein